MSFDSLLKQRDAVFKGDYSVWSEVMKYKIFALLIFFLFTIVTASASDLGFEDCVLKNIKNAQTDAAVGIVYKMCESKSKITTTTKGENNTDEVCYLYFNGIKTQKLTNIQAYTKSKFITLEISFHGSIVANVIIPKDLNYQPLLNSIYGEVNSLCK